MTIRLNLSMAVYTKSRPSSYRRSNLEYLEYVIITKTFSLLMAYYSPTNSWSEKQINNFY